MFVGREKELSKLQELFDENIFQMVVMYGRRRVGKTTLISEFIKGKPAIFFTAQEANDKANLNLFSKKLYDFFSIPDTIGSFTTWNDAFDFVADKTKETQIVLAFDEFPYASNANHSLKSIIQNVIDHKLINSKLFLILCGSQISFMENEVLGYSSPLFGRRTAQLKINPFDYYDAAKMLPSFSNVDKIRFYACIGGTPHYLAQIRPHLTFEENIKRLYFDISGYLYNEPAILLQQEVREPAMYNVIISAIANGASKLNNIVMATGEEKSKVSKYLSTLINLKIIGKEYPFDDTPETSRKGLYQIMDNCYLFWYRFVFKYRAEIESGNGDIAADGEVFTEQLSDFIGKPAFEVICRQYLIRKNQKRELPFIATAFGTWWGNDPKNKIQADFDVIAANRTKKSIILCECKWKNNIKDVAEIRKLIEKEHLLLDYKDRYYYVFSKVPFSDEAKSMANNKVRLIYFEDIFNI